jgi:hypothetical protein
MTSGQDVSEFLGILGLVKSYFSSFFGEKKNKKNREFFFMVLRTPQRIRRFACLQDCLLTLTWHLAVDHTNFLQVTIKTHSFIQKVESRERNVTLKL